MGFFFFYFLKPISSANTSQTNIEAILCDLYGPFLHLEVDAPGVYQKFSANLSHKRVGGDMRRNRQSSQAEKIRAIDVSMDVVLQAKKAETGG